MSVIDSVRLDSHGPVCPRELRVFLLGTGCDWLLRKRVAGNALLDPSSRFVSETQRSVQSDKLCLSPTCTCTSVNCSQLRSTFQSTIVKWIDVLLQSNGLDLVDTHVLLTKTSQPPRGRSRTRGALRKHVHGPLPIHGSQELDIA